MLRRQLDNRGITITELVIVITMASFIAVLLGSITLTFYGAVLRNEVEARMVVDSQIILRDMVDELRISSAVIQTNNIADPYGPGGGWNTNSDDAILIIQTPVLTSSGEFEIDPITTEPYMNELVYFSEDDTMYRRVLLNSASPSNNRRQTCPAANVGSGTCESPDSELSNDYSSMNFSFYDQDNTVTTIAEDARSIDMTINLQRRIFRANVDIQNNIRATLRN